MSYSRWGEEPLGWYIYHNGTRLIIEQGCPQSCAEHTKMLETRGQCFNAYQLTKEKVIRLRDILNEALKEWDEL